VNTRIRLLVLPALLLLALGCSTNTNRSVDLTGKILYKDAPVTGGTMTLYYGDTPVLVAIGADGTFSASQIPEGTAAVTVDTEPLNPKQPKYGGKQGGGMSSPPPGANTGPKGTYVKVPDKYRKKETTDLKLTLERGKQEKTIELKD